MRVMPKSRRRRRMIASFPPLAKPSARIVVLGTMPGARSLEAGEYYAQPRNCFWKLMGSVLCFDPRAPYETRVRALVDSDIALWDVMRHCSRDGSSLDADIDLTTAEPNEFATFFAQHPGVRLACFNGADAARFFKRRVLPTLPRLTIEYRTLPSTSSTHSGKSFEEKLQAWRDALNN